tara:strand:- start:446 stop:610 length:165 start_codon:yes stop_codon:yes gene_type:complete
MKNQNLFILKEDLRTKKNELLDRIFSDVAMATNLLTDKTTASYYWYTFHAASFV